MGLLVTAVHWGKKMFRVCYWKPNQMIHVERKTHKTPTDMKTTQTLMVPHIIHYGLQTCTNIQTHKLTSTLEKYSHSIHN